MNQKPVIAVFDKKIAMYDQPFVCRHVGEAVREWTIVKANKETKIGKNPEDFDLFQIATYDEKSGTFSPVIPHQHLDSGV